MAAADALVNLHGALKALVASSTNILRATLISSAHSDYLARDNETLVKVAVSWERNRDTNTVIRC